jgi:hypothetical protein
VPLTAADVGNAFPVGSLVGTGPSDDPSSPPPPHAVASRANPIAIVSVRFLRT